MAEGRRHSVDIPLSKALVALRRVRSLRDPETSSLDTYSNFMENASWETNSACDPILKLGDHRSDAESELRFRDRIQQKLDPKSKRGGYLSPINSNFPSPSRTPRHRDLGSLSEEELHEGNRSLNQKYRPRTFDEIVGQPVLVQSLRNAILKKKICSVYLFHGPPGTGKTSAAKIFASELNCSSMDENIVELDPSLINSKDSLRTLIRKALHSPISSDFRVLIVDDCQNLSPGAWTAILNVPQEIQKRVIFILITSDLEKVPRVSLSSCQKHQFLKIKDSDIVQRLKKICRNERIEYEEDALIFIAGRAGGSLREAETMLDQISLLGKKITLTLVQELSGVVSETELLNLLDLALSSDAPNTVRKARELLNCKIDPMQLISQMANLIMDILAGRCQILADVGLLRNALKVLSEAEKQLRSSKSRDTWLTAALLQFNSGAFTPVNGCNLQREEERGPKLMNGSLLVGNEKLDAIWRRTVEGCPLDLSRSLLKKGRLTSVHLNQGIAIAQVEISSSELVSKAESSLEAMTNSLESVLCRHVEIRIGLTRCSSFSKVRELTWKWLRCKSGKSQSSVCSYANVEKEDQLVEKIAQIAVKDKLSIFHSWKRSLEFFCRKGHSSKVRSGISDR